MRSTFRLAASWAARALISVGPLVALHGCAPTTRDSSAFSPSADVLALDGAAVPRREIKAPAASVLIFVRSDCPISNRFAPEINRLHSTLGPRGAEFVLVYVDPEEPEAAIRTHLRDFGYSCRAARDPVHALVARYGVTITPEAAVLNASGELVYRGRINDLYADLGRARPAATTHELADAIESTLSGKAVLVPRTRAVGCTIADLKR